MGIGTQSAPLYSGTLALKCNRYVAVNLLLVAQPESNEGPKSNKKSRMTKSGILRLRANFLVRILRFLPRLTPLLLLRGASRQRINTCSILHASSRSGVERSD
jgi:hypothetical protein